MPRPAPAAPSLAYRVLGAVLVILLAGGLLVAGSTWFNGRQAARQAYDRILVGAANDIAESIRIQDGGPFVDLPVSAFELLAQAPDDRIHYAVTGPGGEPVTGFGVLPGHPEHAPGRIAPEFFDADLQGEAARFVTVTRRFAERDFSGEVTVTVGQTLRARRAMALALMVDALLPMVLAGIALMGISWVVIRGAVRPLGALSQDLAFRDPYDLTPMPTEGVPQELRVMLDAMNRFMGRLDRQMGSMRNLISDTAHQLRTPVAAIRVQAETLLEEDSPPGRARAGERLLARTRSLGRLLDQLLSRALVIHRTDSAPRVPVDLREIALEIVERRDHELLAPGAEMRLEIGPEPVMVMAEVFSLEEAAKNLLANALRHGVPPVVLGAEERDGQAALWVADAGPGPAPELLARLGGRFERTAQSQEQSAGLGLAIVKSVAEAFGGRVEMTQEATGFRVALILPAAPGEEAP
ncbi:sensor histidine kinase N-terminal domain-containing protein [Roseivivax sp. GX 12232]|uniref:sensor histidine kinase n=1 Tax=Roseivivax sp. GX 12232 TaxID=2900547 RepID=UPI001E584EAE|nr:sensor histidine kinase [Roseivivax sp. GX 12232]MCE0504807.1 sensor histidine kinase N-terminal domain-containing protein [Roseivivax sp. GX 12232]